MVNAVSGMTKIRQEKSDNTPPTLQYYKNLPREISQGLR